MIDPHREFLGHDVSGFDARGRRARDRPLFPSLYFQRISAGVFNKGLGIAALYQNHLVLAVFCIVFLAAATLLLRKQEA